MKKNFTVSFCSISRKIFITQVMLVLFSLITFMTYAQVNPWTQKQSSGMAPRMLTTAFSIGNKGYVGTGMDPNPNGADPITAFSDFWEYDVATDSWTQKADVPTEGRVGATGFSVGNKGYIGLGQFVYGSYVTDFWEYDPLANSWTQMPYLPSASTGYGTSFTIGNKGYVSGYSGVDGKELWEFDALTKAWTKKANFAAPQGFGDLGFSIGVKGYVGWRGSNDLWEYDPALDHWTQKSSIPGSPGFPGSFRYWSAALSVGTKGYIGISWGSAGADNHFFTDNHFWEYDPSTNQWTQIGNYPGEFKYSATTFSIGSKGYMGMGQGDNGLFNDLWEFDPAASANTITTTITDTSVCTGSSINVLFGLNGTFNTGNSVTAQLSDASGGFTNPLNIGTASTTTSGTINATIPSNIASGTGYRIRTVSSDPAVIGFDNGTNLPINTTGTPSISIAIVNSPNLCVNFNIHFLATVTDEGTSPAYQWKVNGSNQGTNSVSFSANNLKDGDIVTCELTKACATPSTVTSNSIVLTFNPVTTFYGDTDGDGYGDVANPITWCTIVPGFVTNSLDCNDHNAAVHPGATEICGNNIDDDCDGQVDEGCPPSDLPAISVSNSSVTEGNFGTHNASFQLLLSKASQVPVTISYITAKLSAVASSDFIQKSGSVTFPAGTLTQTMIIQVVGDLISEYTETFKLVLSNPVNAVLVNSTATCTIIDDDEPGYVNVYDTVTNERAQSAIVRVSLSKPSGKVIHVKLSTRDGSATAPADYSSTGNVPITFLPGQVTKYIIISVKRDSINEPTEKFTVFLTKQENVRMGRNEAQISIINFAASKRSDDNTLRQSISQIDEILILPNPSDKQLNLKFRDETENKIVKVVLLDNTGRVVRQWNNKYRGKGRLLNLPVWDIANGLYTVVVNDGRGEQLQGKVLIQH